MANESKKESGWEGLKAISGFLAGVLIPIAVAYVGYHYSGAIKEKELSLQYVELAVDILQQEASDANKNIRDWAIEVINKFSTVPFSEATRIELKKFRIPPRIGFQQLFMDTRTLDTIKRAFPDLEKEGKK